MNEHTPIRTRGSLIERAAETFDFRKAIAANAPELVLDEPVFVQDDDLRQREGEGADFRDAPVPMATRLLASTPAREPVVHRTGAIDRDALEAGGFIVPDAPVNALSEEFRIVKRQLLIEAKRDAKARMILVASAQPDEGKTFCAVNLAMSMAAEKDIEVLLVDADFAKPEIVSTLGLEPGAGLMDALSDPAIDVETCIVRTDVANLSVLPAGRMTNSDTEALASAHTAEVLESLLAANPARIVIFDSPPTLAASPASVLALHAGQVLMVVKADQTSEAELRDALGLLAGCDRIQLLLNAVKFAPNGRRFGSYYGYGE